MFVYVRKVYSETVGIFIDHLTIQNSNHLLSKDILCWFWRFLFIYQEHLVICNGHGWRLKSEREKQNTNHLLVLIWLCVCNLIFIRIELSIKKLIFFFYRWLCRWLASDNEAEAFIYFKMCYQFIRLPMIHKEAYSILTQSSYQRCRRAECWMCHTAKKKVFSYSLVSVNQRSLII